MLKFIRAAFICSLVLCTTLASFSQSYTTGVVRVKFKENAIPQARAGRLKKNQIGITSVDQAGTTLGITSIQRVFRESARFEKAHREFGLHLWYEIKFDPKTSVQLALDTYRKLGELEIVEPSLPYQLVEPIKGNSKDALPSAFSGATNDPLFGQQWHYQNTGQGNGTPGADISLPQAWTIQTGSPEVIVAVIDGGIDILHPDLQASLWVNADEIPGNSIDDDHNGYVDDVNGYGFGDNTGRIYANFHGTHVGGTIAAVTNNSVGVAGIAGGNGTGNGVRLMSCAGFGAFGTGGFEDAMVYAADNGAVISQNSWRGGSNAIEAAIDYFVARAGYDNSEAHFDDNIQIGPMAGGIVIFAAGNSNTSDPNDGYPASYSPNMAVAATDHNDVRSVFSNYGTWVDIAAPGTDVFSTYPVELGSYTTLSGTSMACPHVSGVAALIVSQFKGPGYSPFLVWDRIQYTADNIDALNPGFENKLGGGRLNAYQALQVADDVPPSPITTLSGSAKLSSAVLQWTSTGASGNTGAASSYDLRYSQTPITAANFNTAISVAGTPKPKVAGTAEEFEVVGLTQSTTYYFAIKSRDFFGNVSTISNVVSVTTLEPPVIHVTPLSIESALLSGQSESRTITIQNTGTSSLSWNLSFVADAVPGSLSLQEHAGQKLKADDKTSVGLNNNGEQVSTALTDGYSMKAIGDFELKTASPVTLTCLTVDPNTGLIYAQANQGAAFYRYSPVTNQWTQLADCPIFSGNNGGAVFLNGKIYTSYQDYGTMGIYNVAANTWSTMISNLPMGGTGSMTTDGASLYMARGTDFRKYAPLTNTWSTLAASPISFTGWGGISYYNNTIFGHDGNGYAGFAKYNVVADSWTVLPSVPGGTVLGSAIDPGNGIYYAYGSYYGTNWYAYDIDDQIWSVNSTAIPFAIHDGGLAYVSQGGVSGVYFTQGEAGNNFARFETGPSSKWLHVDPLLGVVAAGTSQTVNVSLNAENLNGGTYHGTIDIQHNDPTHGTIEIPVTLVVTGAPALKVNRTSFAFGDVYIGAQHDSVLTITNTGTDVLSVSAMTVGNANYHITFEPFTLSPTGHKDFNIGFRPASPGTYNTNLTITSNDASHRTTLIPLTGRGVFNPLSVSPSTIAVTLATGQQETRQIAISNGGSTALTWNGKINGIGTNRLEDILVNLNASYTQVTGVIPTRYDFSEGESGNSIVDGGSDMYDYGNYLTTNVGGESNFINYTSGSITPDSKFGPSGKYFTSKFQGLFVMAADVEINSFSVTGNLGADGSGYVDAALLSASRGGKSYKGFVKRVYSAYDPSVNHLIIIENSAAPSQEYSPSTDNDFHKINNLSGVKRIYYLLFAGSSGGYIDNASMQTIMEAFLGAVDEGSSWVSLGKKTGTLSAGGSENVGVTFSALNMDGGVYNASIAISDNVPLKEPVSVPVTLTVIGAPDIDLSKTAVNFQNVYVGDLVTRFVSLKNLGSDKLIVSSIVSTNARFTVTPSTVTLNPRDSVRIYVTFSPIEAGSSSGTIQIVSNDSDEGMRTISLSGNGIVPPVADITPAAVNVKIFSGDRKNVEIKIRNTGGDVMSWNISNTWSLPYWSTLSPQAGSIGIGQEQDLKLTIDANSLSLANYTFTIYFNYNSPINPQIAIPVNVEVVQNHPPIVIRSIASQTMQKGDPAQSINLAEYFSDADDEPLLYYAQATNNTVVGATTLGSDLLLTPLNLGESEISVWVVDGLGERADIHFVVDVIASTNHSPVVKHSITDQTIQQHDPAMSINLAEYFSDEDGEPLKYFADANDTIVGASILGSSLLLEPRALGKSKVKVWTVDGLGERADLQFKLTVAAVTGTEHDAAVSSLQNHPNPFSDKTTISYQLKKNGHVQLVVLDITGRVMQTMVDENQLPGEKNIEYKGTAIQSGLYFYHLIVDGKSCGIRKMIKY